MLFHKKERQTHRVQERSTLYPVLHVAKSLKNYQQELVKKEVSSLWELGQVGSSFSNVLKGADQFQTKLQNLGTSFSSINETAEQFGQVQEEITHSIAEARGQMEDLDQVSAQVQQSFDAMSETFAQLEAVIRQLKETVSIPVIAKPNAGIPVITKTGEAVYSMGKEDFTRHILRLADCGASIIGGCCGTTPDYIENIKKSL